MDEQQNVAVIAAEIENDSTALEALQRRVDALEHALDELRNVAAGSVVAGSVVASAGAGRKTVVTVPPREGAGVALDAALGSLSVEQRIAVKSHMLRSGLL